MPLVALLLGVLGLAAPPPVPSTLRCTCTYADEPVVIDVTPTAAPYRVEAVAVGTRFAFRAVWVTAPTELAELELTVFHRAKGGDVPLTQVTYVPPRVSAPGVARYGFTGLHRVYEPDLGSELSFWCAWAEP